MLEAVGTLSFFFFDLSLIALETNLVLTVARIEILFYFLES